MKTIIITSTRAEPYELPDNVTGKNMADFYEYVLQHANGNSGKYFIDSETYNEEIADIQPA